jgi:hypothetical protein
VIVSLHDGICGGICNGICDGSCDVICDGSCDVICDGTTIVIGIDSVVAGGGGNCLFYSLLGASVYQNLPLVYNGRPVTDQMALRQAIAEFAKKVNCLGNRHLPDPNMNANANGDPVSCDKFAEEISKNSVFGGDAVIGLFVQLFKIPVICIQTFSDNTQPHNVSYYPRNSYSYEYEHDKYREVNIPKNRDIPQNVTTVLPIVLLNSNNIHFQYIQYH